MLDIKQLRILNTPFTLQGWPEDWAWLDEPPLYPCSIIVEEHQDG